MIKIKVELTFLEIIFSMMLAGVIVNVFKNFL